MADLHEIVSIAAVERVFVVLAILLPILGAFIGAVNGARSRHTRNGALRGLVVGLIGPLNWLLWQAYNGITNRNGLDTVRNLVINLLLFVIVGVIVGLGWSWVEPHLAGPGASLPADQDESGT